MNPSSRESRIFGLRLHQVSRWRVWCGFAKRIVVTYAGAGTLYRKPAWGRSEMGMHRLIASSLLVVILAGAFAPAALALSPEPPHACCWRKKSHCHEGAPAGPAISSRPGGGHGCCRWLALPQWAEPGLQPALGTGIATEPATPLPHCLIGESDAGETYSGRAPPLSFIA